MKKQTKKLKLAKETLRELDNLDQVDGGGITDTDVNSCIGTCGSVAFSCACGTTSRNTCGSAYC